MSTTHVNPQELLAALRWKEDMRVISPDHGEAIYLKKCPGGLTECCKAEYPCPWHSLDRGSA